MTIRTACWFLSLTLGLPCAYAQTAVDYPSKPIRFIVPYAPGGTSDILARLFGHRLTETLGQTLVVDNRPGAGSMIGTAILAKSAPDGYTIILSDMPHTINPAVYGKVPYDPVKDFTPLSLVARAPMWLFVTATLPARTVEDFVKMAKAEPGKYVIGSGGNGTGTHLLAELLQRGANIKLTHVPFKGAGPSIVAVGTGEVHASFTSMPAALPHVQAGRLRPIGVSTAKRHPSYPEVPTFEESAVRGMVLHHWFGVLAPAGLARPVAARLHKSIVDAVNHPATQDRFKVLILEPATLTTPEFRALIESDLKRWGTVVRAAGIKVQ